MVDPEQASPDVDQPAVVRVRDLHKRFRRADDSVIPAVDGVSLELRAGECLVLLGPSGCGKTTLLRCIAGLESPDSGAVEVHGEMVYSSRDRVDLPAQRRNLSMVFQSYALWPHLTVAENVAYPLRSLPRRSRPSRAEIVARVDAILTQVGISAIAGQRPAQISGGQQQRVALCRALIAGSGLVLFDEPLSNVDFQVRERLREELRAMQHEFGFAAIFVTHDRQEAMALGDSIAVLESGHVAQLGTPREVYSRPRSRYVAHFVGPVNEFPVTAVSADENSFTAKGEHGQVHGRTVPGVPVGEAGTAAGRPEDFTITTEPVSGRNCWPATVEGATFYGAHTHYALRSGEQTVHVSVGGASTYEVGARVWLSAAAECVWLLPEDSESVTAGEPTAGAHR
jgi:iron(III) transport system ATP-binding protein